MTDDTGPGYASLRALRALERRMVRLARRWRRFRREPGSAALADLRSNVRDVAGALADLEGVLEPFAAGPSAPVPERSAPPARDVIQASRELDACIWRASGEWQGFQKRPGAGRLEAVESLLRLAVGRAETLRRALWTAVPPSTSPPRPVSPGTSSPGVEDLEQNLDALLWRITSDWQHVRRAPAPDRIGVLRDEIEEALNGVSHLRVAFGADARPLGAAAEPVRAPGEPLPFHPYRDGFTGCYNREGFDAAAGAELKRCRRYRRNFGLLAIEIASPGLSDLRDIVDRISTALREYDILGRYVDRLFVVGLPESGPAETEVVARRVEEALRVEFGGRDGVAAVTAPEDGKTLSDLLGAARRRLAEAGAGSPPELPDQA
ncbi:MAG: hypothetical protein ACE5HF_04100 [Gemmatimonadota bacterium]